MLKYFILNFGLNLFVVIFLQRLDSFNFISYVFGMFAILISNILFNKFVYENTK